VRPPLRRAAAFAAFSLLIIACGDGSSPDALREFGPPPIVRPPPAVECVAPEDCGIAGACRTSTCDGGVCGVSFAAAGTPTDAQTDGDCHRDECDGAGNVVSAVDDADPADDGNVCTNDACMSGVEVHWPVEGRPCGEGGGSSCGADGVCLQ
jgi:hypothetical protein